MTENPPVVFVVDDDPSVCKALGRLLRADGLSVETFGLAREFLLHRQPEAPGCLVLDVTMPGLDGLQLQQALKEAGASLPIVFVTGDGDIPMSVQAMKAGAVDFLPKPFRDQDLLGAVRQAIAIATAAARGAGRASATTASCSARRAPCPGSRTRPAASSGSSAPRPLRSWATRSRTGIKMASGPLGSTRTIGSGFSMQPPPRSSGARSSSWSTGWCRPGAGTCGSTTSFRFPGARTIIPARSGAS
jgi:FixJ family two-component response regulator